MTETSARATQCRRMLLCLLPGLILGWLLYWPLALIHLESALWVTGALGLTAVLIVIFWPLAHKEAPQPQPQHG
ncbi:hypothetical protein ACUY3K_02870 [Corynebacterium uberis]|uniref:hypothetical protein n=1 Tax=Corynebacterium uberis TaxID=2883169 RepID=UPI001D09D177|nr:hypothetical protein [Corynebacterium uberis]UDL73461.1 hypothetical protein LH391_10350 [Corynebacterium uberis]UDL75659.1 hypothetical protein LH393_10575 [Corynebacterium uberis]UDL77872.1 hypothetical protein LH394_10560 [Corynebacterium uberis]UDL80155.1 hypothetical protein LH392_10980 [Corynebacterium uberis]UDL82288.1 hypothetical protein LH395_10565 [Corynebacterium uberis]